MNQSLWLDESMLALNIVNRSILGLLQPLDFNQGSPLLFLIIEKFFISVFGNNEFSLRLFPLISGIAVLFLVYFVGKIYFSETIALMTLFIVAISPQLITYSTEVKQYSTDVMATLIIFFLSSKCTNLKSTKKDFIILAIIGSFLIFLSHAVLFSLISCCIVMLIYWFPNSSTIFKKYTFLTVFLWFSLYIIFFLISLNSLTKNNTLTDYWQSYFFPYPPWNNIDWLKMNIVNNLRDLFEFQFDPIFFLFFLILGSLIILFSKNRVFLSIFFFPNPICLLFSSFHIFPFGDRMILFIIPIVYFVLIFGICSFTKFFVSLIR